jgi:two-component system chemotaxis response regulator CheB
MAAAQADDVEAALWTALRTLEERAALYRHFAERVRARGAESLAAAHELQAIEADSRADTIRQVLLGNPEDGVRKR